jgi:hypothetical protein
MKNRQPRLPVFFGMKQADQAARSMPGNAASWLFVRQFVVFGAHKCRRVRGVAKVTRKMGCFARTLAAALAVGGRIHQNSQGH